MRCRLRTLMIWLAVGPPLLAAAYFWWKQAIEWTISSLIVLVVSVAVFYIVVLAWLLVQQWKTYGRPHRPR